MAVTNSPSSFPPLLFSPAKTPTVYSNTLILRTPLLILRTSAKSIPLSPPRAATPPQKYVYPDPIPEFAKFETEKFRAELLKRLLKDKEAFGDDLLRVVDVCSEIFSDFLHMEYGGPGTLLVEPFTDMLVSLKEKKLPGSALAARTSLLWAQNHVDNDWQIWNSNPSN